MNDATLKQIAAVKATVHTGATSGHRTTSSDPPRIGRPPKICACPSMASVQNCSLLQKDNSRPTGFGALRLLRAAHLREGDYRPRPHQPIDRCPCQKQKPGGDHDSNIGDEPNQDRMQRVAHANPPNLVHVLLLEKKRA